MPSATVRHLGNPRGPMQGLASPASYRPPDVFITPLSVNAVGEPMAAMGVTMASSTYPAANRALGFPFEIVDNFVVVKVFWMNGTTATTDNADVGVYDEAGTTLLVSGGSTAIATANVVQEKDCTDTLLTPGRYWCVYNQNGVTATPMMFPATAANIRAMGCAQFAGAVALGSTFTPAGVASANFPMFGIASRTQVA